MFKEIRYQKEFRLNDFYLVGEITNNYQKQSRKPKRASQQQVATNWNPNTTRI